MKLLDTMVMTESEEQVEKNTSVLRAGLVMSLLSIFLGSETRRIKRNQILFL